MALRCAGYGRVDGAFGQTLARHMADVPPRDERFGQLRQRFAIRPIGYV
jgi:hypothetical protein